MNHIFKNKRISSILTVLPSKVVNYEDELESYPFPVEQSKRLGMMMDYRTRRQCEIDDCLSDYALYGIKHLLQENIISLKEIEGVVVCSSSQDYIMPSVSYIIQGKLNLDHNVFCCDLIQQCGGYQFGLCQSFMLMDTYNLNKILLITGEMTTKKIGPHDRNAKPIIGDAVSISVVEKSNNGDIFSTYLNYGQQASSICIPAGGLKMPCSPQTAIEEKDEQGNYRALDHFYMDGEAVFNFVMTKVPPMINSLLKDSNNTIDSIDYFLFHQPNKFMVDRLADELEIPQGKYFDNIVGLYGNASTATVPLNLCHNIGNIAIDKSLKLCLSGFGGGLTCNAIIMNNPSMDFCQIIDYKK